jgi:transposase InsO family protein
MLTSSEPLNNVKETQHSVATAIEGADMKVRTMGALTVSSQQAGEVEMGPAFVPEGLADNLLSVSSYLDVAPDRRVVFGKDYCVFSDENGQEVIKGTREGGHFVVRLPVPSGAAAVARKKEVRFAPHPHTFVASDRRRSKRKQRGWAKPALTRARSKEQRSTSSATSESGSITFLEEQRLAGLVTEPPDSVTVSDEAAKTESAAEAEAMALHRKLHHLNLHEVKWMVNHGKAGEVSENCKSWFKGKTKFGCAECAVGKISKKPLKRKSAGGSGPAKGEFEKKKEEQLRKLKKKKVEEVYAGFDLNGPNARSVGSHTGCKYALLLRKRESRYSWLRFLKKKSDTYDVLKVLLPLVLTTLLYNQRLIILSDLGTEFVSEKVENLLSSLGIGHRYTSRNSSLKNGVVERHFRTLEQDVATLRTQAGLTKGYWADLMQTAHDARLHLPSRSLPCHRSPFEEEKGEDSAPFRERFKPVGCKVVGLNVTRTSMGDRGGTEQLIFLGGKEGGDGNRLLNLDTRKVVDDRSARFIEDVFPGRLSKAMRRAVYDEERAETDALSSLETRDDAAGTASGVTRVVALESDDDDDEEPEPLRRSTRVRGKPDDFQPTLEDQTKQFLRSLERDRAAPSAFFAAALRLVEDEECRDAEEERDPTSYSQAMRKDHWRQGLAKEMEKLWENRNFCVGGVASWCQAAFQHVRVQNQEGREQRGCSAQGPRGGPRRCTKGGRRDVHRDIRTDSPDGFCPNVLCARSRAGLASQSG